MKALRKIYVDEGFNAGTDGGYTDEPEGTNNSAYISQQDLVECIKEVMSESIPGDLVEEPPTYTERYWFLYKELEKILNHIKEE